MTAAPPLPRPVTSVAASRPIPVSVAPTGLRVRRQPGETAVLLVAAFGAFLAFLDSTIVNVAFPNIRASFPHADLSTLSWVLNAYNIVLASFLVAAGRFCDLLGRKRLFVVGVVIFTVASGLCAAAGSVGQLIGFRVLQGFGAALLIPASLALVVEGFQLSRRAHGVGLWGAAAAIASGLGPPIGGLLVSASSWRLAFLVNVPLGVVAVVLAQRKLVESRSPGVRRLPDMKGALLLSAALGALTVGVIKGPDWGWSDVKVVVAFVVAAAALAGFVQSSRTHRVPLIDPAYLKMPSFAIGNALTIAAGMGFYAYMLTHILYLNTIWHYSLLRAGFAVAPAAFVAAVVASVLGKVADRRGHRLILVPGALIWAGSLVWYLERVGTTPDFLHQWLPGQLIQGLGVGATLPVLGSASLARLPKGGGYATASAVGSSARQLGAVLGIAILVIFIGTPHSVVGARTAFRHGWMFAACCFLVVAVGSLFLGRTAQDAEHAADAMAEIPLPPPRAVPAELQVVASETVALPDGIEDLPMFRGLSARSLQAVRRAAEEVELEAGRYLFRQGDRSDALYVVRSGRLQVVQGDVVLTELSRGAVLGELGLLTDDVRSASVRAVRDSRLVRLGKSEFDAVANVAVMTNLARGLATRLQEIAPPSTSRLGTPDTVIAVVGLDAAAPADEVGERLVQQMRRHVRVLDPGRVDRDGLERAERDADKVVLSASGRSPKAWRDFCLRVADRVVLVTGDPAVPAKLPARAQGCDLVLAGPTVASREQRREWEERTTPRSVVDASLDVEVVDALGRRLTGRSLGIVFGGGGARGFGHLGVLEELESAGVVVDRVAGTSVGAVIGSGVAAGMSAAEVDAHVYEYFVRSNPVGDYTLPTKGLVRGRRAETRIQQAFGGRLIEELPKEFRCVSVDLLNRRRVVHRSGPTADAVLCSLRLPGVFAPYVHGGTLHVDGGVLDNLPVSALDRSEGPIIAVNVGAQGPTPPASADVPAGPPRIPGLGDTLVRTMTLASGDAAEEAMAAADLVLRPDATGVGFTEWHQIDRMRDSGRATARASMGQILELLAR